MFDAVKMARSSAVGIDSAIEKWNNFPFSVLSHHGFECCQIAREWLVTMDFAQLNNANPLTAPRWLRQRYSWGACQWPLHWCDGVRRTTLDCGALGAMAHEVFTARGVRSFPVQMIQKFNFDAAEQWKNKWNNAESSTHWLEKDLIYHEGCAVAVSKDEIKIWDASAGWWINPHQPAGYGSLSAVKIFVGYAPVTLNWGAHRLVSNQWQKIKQA